MRIALTGNPNSGKTTMYNALTGRNEKIGNLYEKFKEYTNVDASVKKAHVKNIDKKYKKKSNKSNKKSKSDEKTTYTDVGQCICSKCGYELYPLDEVCDRCGNKV